MIWWPHWRGRLGLSGEEALALYDRASGQHLPRRKQQRQSAALGDEPIPIQFQTWDGEELQYPGFEGETVKDVAQRHELVEAICGGLQECATCHVMLQGEGLPEQPEVSDDEE